MIELHDLKASHKEVPKKAIQEEFASIKEKWITTWIPQNRMLSGPSCRTDHHSMAASENWQLHKDSPQSHILYLNNSCYCKYLKNKPPSTFRIKAFVHFQLAANEIDSQFEAFKETTQQHDTGRKQLSCILLNPN
jgi:hypothetical protein